jgi:hypothetical protein
MVKKYIIKPLILFLLLSQFVTIVHAIEHQLVQEENEQCLICLHETHSKNLLADTTNTKSSDFGTYQKINYTPSAFHLTKPSFYSIRSPPTILI